MMTDDEKLALLDKIEDAGWAALKMNQGNLSMPDPDSVTPSAVELDVQYMDVIERCQRIRANLDTRSFREKHYQAVRESNTGLCAVPNCPDHYSVAK